MSDIIVRPSNQKIIVNPVTNHVSVVRSGPQGPRGAQGPPGTSGEGGAHDFVQVEAASSWLINHNLGVKPIFNVFEAITGIPLWPGEIHHSLNQLELTFLTPRAGTARLRS